MGRLIKNVVTTYIPGDPGNPGSPYVPGSPGGWTPVQYTECSAEGAPTTRVVNVYPNGPSLFEQLGLVTNSGTTSVQLLAAVDIDADGDGKAEYTRFTVQISGVAGVCTVKTKYVYSPPVAAIPAVPYSPPTPAQISVSLNQGWNSYARTVDKLLPGTFLEYTVKHGSHAVLMAVGKRGMEGAALPAFPYGVLVDTTGAYSFESGVAVALAGTTPGLPIRIARLSDGRIVYSVGGEAAKISAVGTYDLYDELYVYGLLYAGYDEVTTAQYIAGDLIVEPTSTMRGAGALSALPLPRVTLAGSGDLLVAFTPGVVLNGYGTLSVEFSNALAFVDVTMSGSSGLTVALDAGGRASFTLGALEFFASDEASGRYNFLGEGGCARTGGVGIRRIAATISDRDGMHGGVATQEARTGEKRKEGPRRSGFEDDRRILWLRQKARDEVGRPAL